MSYVRSKRYPELFRPGSGAIWWAFLPNPEKGPKLRESTKHSDELAAHRWYLERIRRDPAETARTKQAQKKDRSLADALVTRIEWLRAARQHDDPTRKKLALSTIEFYENHGKPLVRILGPDTPLSTIDHETIRRYIIERSKEVKGTTIAKDLVTLSGAMRFARKDGVVCASFADIVPDDFVALYMPRTRWLSESEVDTLLAFLPPRRAAVVAFIVATGATYPSEVSPIRKSHINGWIVHIPGTKRKTRDRWVHVPSHARKYLTFALKHIGPWGFDPWIHIGRDIKKAAKLLSMCEGCRVKAPLGGAGWHKKNLAKCLECGSAEKFAALSPNDLRRTFVQWLVRSGVPYELVYPMAGHSSPRMLETVYGRRDAGAVADLVELALAKAPKGARKRIG